MVARHSPHTDIHKCELILCFSSYSIATNNFVHRCMQYVGGQYSKLSCTVVVYVSHFFSRLVLVQQGKHCTTACLFLVSAYGRPLDMIKMEDTWGGCPLLLCKFNSSLHFHMSSYSSISTASGWFPSGSSLPTLPSPSTPLRIRTWKKAFLLTDRGNLNN